MAIESVEVDPSCIISDHGLVSCCIYTHTQSLNSKFKYVCQKLAGIVDRPTLFEAIRKSPIGSPLNYFFKPRPFICSLSHRTFCNFWNRKLPTFEQALVRMPGRTSRLCQSPSFTGFQNVSADDVRRIIMPSPTKSCSLDLMPTSVSKETSMSSFDSLP